MIPIALTIEGIYSYEKEVTINFQDLASEGIFGIFGKVGSGKSAIVEAISVALYGRTDRYSVSGMSSNLLNLNANAGKIIFTFKNFKGSQYQTNTRLIPRKGNRAEVRREFKILEWKNEEWVAADQNMEEIIGLNYSNFKRTILIPQGQFREFIELKPSDKNQMMQELFQLERFDLFGNTAQLLNNAKEIKQFNEGILSQLAPYMEVSLDEKKHALKLLTQHIKQLQTEVAHHQLQITHTEKTFNAWSKWKEATTQLNLLKERETEMMDLKQKIQTQEYYQFYIQPTFQQWNDAQSHIKNSSNHLQNHKLSLLKINNELKQLQQNETELLKLQKEWPIKRNQIQEYDYLKAIKQFTTDLEYIQKETVTLKDHQRAILDQLKEAEIHLKQWNIISHDLEQQLIHPELLLKVQDAYRISEDLHKEMKQKSLKIQELKQKSLDIDHFFSDHHLDKNYWKQSLTQSINQLKKEELSLSQKLKGLEVQQELTHLSTHLTPGESCPLCGSLDHPHPLNGDFKEYTPHISKINQQINGLKEQQNELQKLIYQVTLKVEEQQLIQEKITALLQQSKELSKLLEKHINHTEHWGSFNPHHIEEFILARDNDQKTRKQWDKLRKNIQQLTSEMNVLKNKELEIQNTLNPLIIETQKLEGRIDSGQEYIRNLPFIWANEKTTQQLEEEKKLLLSSLEKEDLDWTQHQQAIQEISKQKYSLEELIKKEEEQLIHWGNQFNQLTITLHELIRKYQFKDIDQIDLIAQQQFALEEKRNELKKYESEWSKWTFQSEQFDESVRHFKIEQLENIHTQFKNAQELLTKKTNDFSILQQQIFEFTQQQNKYQETAKALEVMDQRIQNLNTLSELFKGKKFVEFASAYWLKRLVRNSNKFFEPLTHHQLSLQLNEQLDFEIIDYLNGGQARGLRTLSGGQSFQVALSLALALAEGIQANFNAHEQFFFIDEGFGTLDDDAIQHVYETLTQLVSKQRKIGVISHVTGLQEQIPKFLSIYKKEEGGSIIL